MTLIPPLSNYSIRCQFQELFLGRFVESTGLRLMGFRVLPFGSSGCAGLHADIPAKAFTSVPASVHRAG